MLDSNATQIYTQDQVEAIAKRASQLAIEQALHQPNLDNGIGLSPEGDDNMKRIKQQVTVNGVDRWVTGNTMQDIMDSYLKFCIAQGVVVLPDSQPQQQLSTPLFGPYITNFNKIYKSQQQSLTIESRKSITEKHIIPRWGNVQIDKIKISDIQLWFNTLEQQGYAHETLLKIRNNMSPALDAAVEDGYIQRNPMKSTRLKIGGKSTVHHKAIPHDKMEVMRNNIPLIDNHRVRRMAALLANTGMRFEEVLGLKWEDIDADNGWIYIQRAVVHPKRNMPEVKPPKSESSERKIPFTKTLEKQLGDILKTGFVLTSDDGKSPLSYTEARRCFDKIRMMFELGSFTAHDFRDTCATEWREAGMSTDLIARMLGHSKSDITENRYVKYRDEIFQGVRGILDGAGKTQNGTNFQV